MRYLGLFVLGLCQGYVTFPACLASAAAGPWLAKLRHSQPLRVTSTATTIALIVVLFAFQTLLAAVVIRELGPDRLLAGSWFGGFVAGFFIYGYLPILERGKSRSNSSCNARERGTSKSVD